MTFKLRASGHVSYGLDSSKTMKYQGPLTPSEMSTV